MTVLLTSLMLRGWNGGRTTTQPRPATGSRSGSPSKRGPSRGALCRLQGSWADELAEPAWPGRSRARVGLSSAHQFTYGQNRVLPRNLGRKVDPHQSWPIRTGCSQCSVPQWRAWNAPPRLSGCMLSPAYGEPVGRPQRPAALARNRQQLFGRAGLKQACAAAAANIQQQQQQPL